MFGNVALHPVLPASDLERAEAWYSDKLGLEPVEVNDYGDLRFRTGACEFLVINLSSLVSTRQLRLGSDLRTLMGR